VAQNFFVLPRPDPPRVLLTSGPDGWSLPAIQTPCLHKWWRESLPVNEAIRREYGLDVVVLRCVRILSNRNDARAAIFLVSGRDPDQEPTHGSWVPEQDLTALSFADSRHRDGLFEAIGRLPDTDGVPLMPWERAGWFQRAAAWLTDQAEKAGRELSGPVIQVRNHGCYSSVLRAPTTDGTVYLKACPSMWAQEPVLTADLAAHQASLVPAVLAVQAEQCWLLTAEAAGRKLKTLGDRELYLSLWQDLLTDYGQAQLEYARDPSRLRRLGCPDWSVERLSRYVPRFLLDLIPALGEEHPDFPVWSRAELEAATARLERLCSRLAAYNIPDTLHHGDFHSVNILTDGRSCRVVDWAFQAGISHPFFFMSVVFEEHTDPAIRSRLRDHYLRLWTDFEPMNRLIEAFELAQPVALLHAAIGHYVQLSNTRAPWESRQEKESLAFYLSCLLDSTDM